MPSSICNECQVLVNNRFDGRIESSKHHKAWIALTRSVRRGCDFCALVQKNAVGVLDRPKLPPEGFVEVWGNDSDHYLTFPNDKRSAEPGSSAAAYRGSPMKIVPTSTQALSYDRPEPDTSTLDGLPLARYRFRNCQMLHHGCKTLKQRYIPTRLINVSQPFPRLQLAREVDPATRYVSLSHCWGFLDYSKLTTGTLSEFKRRIPAEALPKTFRHAIAVSKYLGIMHIWIDSLCILQDSTEDWERECSSMADVYGNCDLNIAATSAEDASVGCFFKRSLGWRCQASASAGSESLFEFYSKRALDPRRNALRYRAWVYQERYLSRRTLHFAENQLFWECKEKPACELFPFGYPPHVKQRAFRLPKHTLSLTKWPEIVQAYSMGRLTRASDRLIAIGGLAKAIHIHTKVPYFAGLWKINVEDQLCWANHGLVPVERYFPYVAPTWSWASLPSEVSYEKSTLSSEGTEFQGHLCVTVREIDILYASGSPFGQIQGGCLRLQCEFLFEALVEQNKGVLATRFVFGEKEVQNISLWYDSRENCVHERTCTRCLILPIRHGIRGLATEGCSSVGLLLEPARDEGKENRRIGFFWALSTESFQDGTRHANLVGQNGKEYFSEVSLRDGGAEVYAIDIV